MTCSAYSSLWGADASSDLIRVAQSYWLARRDATLLIVPPHPVFSSSTSTRFNFRSGTPAQPQETDFCLAHMAEFLTDWFPEWAPSATQRAKTYRSDELVLQVDNAYAQIDSGDHAPAPLNYYRYVLETRYWKKVTLIDWGKEASPVSQHLLNKYPKIKQFRGGLKQSWELLRRSSNMVIGASILAQALSVSSAGRQRIWVPSYAKRSDFTSSSSREVNSVELNQYFANQEWRAGCRQREELLSYPSNQLADFTRWKFTETERCRSFQFCQSCRDKGPTGKLWRQIIQQRFDVPERDWACPHGWKWGGKPNLTLAIKKRLKIGTVIKKTTTALGVKPCADCVERGEKLDGTRH